MLTGWVSGTYNADIETAALPHGAAGTTAFALLSFFEISKPDREVGESSAGLRRMSVARREWIGPLIGAVAIFVFFDNLR